MDKTITTEEVQLSEKRIQFLSKTFSITGAITIITTLGFALLVVLNSNDVFRNFIFNFFKQIPYVGQGLHLLIKSMNIIDLKMVYQTVMLPLISVELVYYSIFLIIFEIILLILKHKFIKNSRHYFSFFLITIIAGVLLLFNQVNLFVIPLAQGSALDSRNLFIKVLLLIQFIAIIAIASNYHKLNKFDIKDVLSMDLMKRMIKIGSLVTMITLLLFGSVLMVANSQVSLVKEAVTVDYVLDFKPTADGAVNIELPSKLILSSKLLGINLPKTIEGGALLEYFAVSEVNIGEVVSQFALDFIDNLAYQYLIIPMSNAFITVLLIGILLIFNAHKYKMPFSHLALDSIQFILAFIISFVYLAKFGIIISIFGALILVASGLNLYLSFINSSAYQKLQTLTRNKKIPSSI